MKKYSRLSFLFLVVLTIINFRTLFFPQAVNAAGLVSTTPANVSAVSGPGAGQVTLYWSEVPYANRYAVTYGENSNHYIYGGLNIGGQSSRSYTVNYLSPGQRYYFKLMGAHDNDTGPASVEISAVAGAGGVIMPVTSPVGGPVVSQPAVSAGNRGLAAVSGPGAGEVTLSFLDRDSADNYNLLYGTKPGVYQYGALNIGRNKYTVKSLIPGTTYYFALVPLIHQRPLNTTAAVSAVAGGGYTTQVVMTSYRNLMQERPWTPPAVQPPPEVMRRQTEDRFPAVQGASTPPQEPQYNAPRQDAPQEVNPTEADWEK